MDEEEKDRILLSNLGITSVNPEDIEHKILSEVKPELRCGTELGESSEEPELDGKHEIGPSSSTQIKLYNKLRAVKVEIDAVASSIGKGKCVAQNENRSSGDTDIGEDKDVNICNGSVQATPDGLNLHQALATDRLESLKKTKAKLQKEISKFGKHASAKDSGHEDLLGKLVKEEPKLKQKSKSVAQFNKVSKPRLKTVTYDEDADFDAVLDAASAGFIETERDELVRKGILTPFHKLKGFERRFQQPGPSNSHNVPEEGTNDDLASSSIARVAKSMSEIAQARPTTKLLDEKEIPGLDAPTRPFQRLKVPLKHPSSENTERSEKKKRKLRKTRRPLPDKKWRKDNLGNERAVGRNDGESRGGSSASDYDEENQEEVEDTNDGEQAPVILEGGLKIPHDIYIQLFDYQKVGVQWLWELHCQRAGGIIGDEMGLVATRSSEVVP